MSDFDQASAVRHLEHRIFQADVPDGWQQGRGAFGGLVLAILLSAMEKGNQNKQRRTRVFTGDIIAPVQPGLVEIRVEVLREGAHQTNLAATMYQNNQCVCKGTSVMSDTRNIREVLYKPAIPVLPSQWKTQQDPPLDFGLGPTFSKHYKYYIESPPPFSSHHEPVATGFISTRSIPERISSGFILGLLDAWWPALFSIDHAPRPMATVSFTAELIANPEEVTLEKPLFYRGNVAAYTEGFALEYRELWSSDHRLIAMNQQTFAVLG